METQSEYTSGLDGESKPENDQVPEEENSEQTTEEAQVDRRLSLHDNSNVEENVSEMTSDKLSTPIAKEKRRDMHCYTRRPLYYNSNIEETGREEITDKVSDTTSESFCSSGESFHLDSSDVRGEARMFQNTNSSQTRSSEIGNLQSFFKLFFCSISAALFGILIAFVIGHHSHMSTLGIQNSSPRFRKYQSSLIKIQNEFPNQNYRLWKIVKIALESHLNSSGHKQPAVLLFASDEDGNPTTECLAQKISTAFSSNCAIQDAKIVGIDLDPHPQNSKWELDDLITSSFQKGACSVVVSRFEQIPAFATTVFYQFCDNDNAPFKDVAIIFTVQVMYGTWGNQFKDLSNLPPTLWDAVVSGYLANSLQTRDPASMTEEMVWGLMSRVTPSIVWVTKEKNYTC